MYTIPEFAWHYFWCLHSPSHYLGNLCLTILYIYYMVCSTKAPLNSWYFPFPRLISKGTKEHVSVFQFVFFTFLFIWFLATYNSKLVGTDLISIPQVRSIAEVFFWEVTGMTHDSVSPNATGYAPGGCWTFFLKNVNVSTPFARNIWWILCERNLDGMYRMS